jgi:hypothetical protein
MTQKIYAILTVVLCGTVCQADASVNPSMIGSSSMKAGGILNVGGPFNGATIAGPISGTPYSGVDIAKMSLLKNIALSNAITPGLSMPQGGAVSMPSSTGSSTSIATPLIHQNKPIYIPIHHGK